MRRDSCTHLTRARLLMVCVSLLATTVLTGGTAAAETYVTCPSSGTYSCNLSWVAGTNSTRATGTGKAASATFISIELTLEMLQTSPYGASWVSVWIDRSGRSHDSAYLESCEPGTYRWRVRVKFANKSGTTYHKTGRSFVLV
jgi:hypothetical protein